MTRFLKLFLGVLLVACTLILSGANVRAEDPLQDACSQGSDASICQNISSDNPIFGPKGLITRATQIITIIVGVASVIMIIIGGFRYIISTGDPNATKGAKDTILYAVIGLAIALVAQALVLFVLRRL